MSIEKQRADASRNSTLTVLISRIALALFSIAFIIALALAIVGARDPLLYGGIAAAANVGIALSGLACLVFAERAQF